MKRRIPAWVVVALAGFGMGGALVAVQPGQHDREAIATGLACAVVAVAVVELVAIWWPRR
jgi:drug/metabolite transporter (DMT)-like permease